MESKTEDLDQKTHQWRQSAHRRKKKAKSSSVCNRRGTPQMLQTSTWDNASCKDLVWLYKGYSMKHYRCGPGCPLQQVRRRKKTLWLGHVTTPLQVIWKFPEWMSNLLALRHPSRDAEEETCPARSAGAGWADPVSDCTLGGGTGRLQRKIQSMAPVLCPAMSTEDFGLDPNLIKSVSVFWVTAAVFA